MPSQHSIATIALQVRDDNGKAYAIRLAIAEQTRQGTLTIHNAAGEVHQQVELARLQKSRDGKTLSCRVGMTTATVTIDGETEPPQLHIAARAFLPLFQATYTLSHDEQQRLVAWMQTVTL
jgi:hypothetical protein